jgi:hypothetical protein
MIVKELMIGNWVIALTEYREKQKQVRVWQIRDTIIIGYNQGWYSIDRLAPIPITEDFLRKNGFIHKCQIEPDEYYPEGLFEWEKEVQGNCVILKTLSNKVDCDWCVHIDNCDRDSICNIDIQYVHQLQNVLNILGIEMEVTP